jgi:hypothetical protein
MWQEADAMNSNMLRSPVLAIGKATAVSEVEMKLSTHTILHDHQNILQPTMLLPMHHVAASCQMPRLCATSSWKPLLEAMPPKRPLIMPEYLIARNHFCFDGRPGPCRMHRGALGTL